MNSPNIFNIRGIGHETLMFLALCCAKLEGATTWIGGNGDIGNAASWNNGIPTEVSIGTIEGGNAITYSQTTALNNKVIIVEGIIPTVSSLNGGTLSMSDANLTLRQNTSMSVSDNLVVGWAGTGDSFLSLQNQANLDITASLIIGRKKRGIVSQGGSSTVSASSLVMGSRNGGANSNYTITGGVLDITNNAEISRQSEFTIDGGTVNIGMEILSKNADSTITLKQGQLNVADKFTINSGSKLNIQGGTTDVTGHFTVKNTNSQATISNGTILIRSDFRAQKGGLITQTGGGITTSGTTLVTNNGSVYNLSSGTLTTKHLTIQKSGVFNHTGGTHTVQKNGLVDTSGIYNQAGSVQIGNNLTINNGTWNGQSSTLDITNHLRLTTAGSTFSQTGTNVTVGNDLVVNAGAQYTLEGSALLKVENKFIINVDNNFTWKNGGTIAVHPNASIINYEGDMIASSGAVLNLNSETEKLVVSGAFSYDNLTLNGYDLNFANKRANSQLTGCITLIEANSLSGSGIDLNFTDNNEAHEILAGTAYNPLTDNVYWYESSATQVSLCWNLAPIPEPSTSLLLLLGSSCFICRRNR